MATYAIGDVHGCLNELKLLLTLIDFDASRDKLWFVGDLVDRGPDSLAVLRLVHALKDAAIVVLGNHDMHLLALQYHVARFADYPLLVPIFNAPDAQELLTWLATRPLLHHDPKLGYVMVHSGLPPQWDLVQAQSLAHEVETTIQRADNHTFFQNMYGDLPDLWQENLVGDERLRFIVNALTRMRFCDVHGRLNLTAKVDLSCAPLGFFPWFQIPARKTQSVKIIFGHWAALAGKANTPNIYAIDTGCVWGGSLTALRLEDEQRFSIKTMQVVCDKENQLRRRR